VATVLVGFAGVALVLRPTLQQEQLGFGLAGLLSGVLSALAYLQVRALGRAGEPEERVVFYFSLSGVVAGALVAVFTGGVHASHSLHGLGLLLAIGVLATVAQWLLTRAYAIGATLGNAALLYMGIVFGALFGVLLFDDPLNAVAVAGMLLIAGAGVASTWLSQRLAPAQRSAPAAATSDV
jgi:S-adenosylmethionine uptake transporter